MATLAEKQRKRNALDKKLKELGIKEREMKRKRALAVKQKKVKKL